MDLDTQKRFENLRGTQHTIPKIGSWIRTFRRFLGMSQKQLAQRLSISSPSLYQLEQNEIEGKISIKNLERIANAMDCELVYFLAPRDEFKKIRESRAHQLASEFLSESADTQLMRQNPIEKQEAIHLLVNKLINSKQLWNGDEDVLRDICQSENTEQRQPEAPNNM